MKSKTNDLIYTSHSISLNETSKKEQDTNGKEISTNSTKDKPPAGYFIPCNLEHLFKGNKAPLDIPSPIHNDKKLVGWYVPNERTNILKDNFLEYINVNSALKNSNIEVEKLREELKAEKDKNVKLSNENENLKFELSKLYTSAIIDKNEKIKLVEEKQDLAKAIKYLIEYRNGDHSSSRSRIDPGNFREMIGLNKSQDSTKRQRSQSLTR